MGAPVRTVKKWLLGREIKHMIDASGKKQTEAGALIEAGQPRMAQLISGVGTISVGDLTLLANGLGFTDPGYREALLELRRENHKRGFWSTDYHRAYREDVRLLIESETHADQIRVAQVEIIPGLAQCESYVRAIHADLSDEGGITLDDWIKARVSRQGIYDKPNSPIVHFVLSESCLRRVRGDKAIMREQLDYLMKLSNRPNIMVQVMPFDTQPGRRSPIGTRFTLLRVPSPGVAGPLEFAYIEGEGEIRYVDDKKALAAHDTAWARLSTAALSYEDSRKFIRQVAKDFR